MPESTIFLSYALEDSDAARRVVRAIEDRGWPISWERYARPDPVAAAALRAASNAASCVLVLWSESSATSPAVLDEAGRARRRGVLVQACLDDAPVPMPFVLDATPRLGDAASIERLLDRVGRLVEAVERAELGSLGTKLLDEADALADTGDFDAAITRYQRWVAGMPGDVKAVRRLADLLVAAERQEDAADVYARLAEHYATSGFLVLAIETYRTVTALVPYREAYARRLQGLVNEKALLTSGARRAISAVQFTVTAPAYASAGDAFALDVWAHRDEDRIRVERRLVDWSQIRPRNPESEPLLSTSLHIDGLSVATPVQDLRWSRGLGVVSFDIETPSGAAPGGRSGVVGVYLMGLQIARVHFTVQVSDVTSPPEVIPSRQERHSRALAVYAPEDRRAVEAYIREFESAAPGVSVQLESVESSSGFFEVLASKDVLYLFWSTNAARSSAVERQWRLALRARGMDFIDPVPLVPPEIAPPPPELAMLRGGDWRVRLSPSVAPPGAPRADRDNGPKTNPPL